MDLRIRTGLVWAAWLGCWMVALILTHIPIQPGGSSPIPHVDKAAHFALYFCVAYLGGLRLRFSSQTTTRAALLSWAFVYLVYGVIDEITQPITGREADISDWIFDAIGVVLATLAIGAGMVPRWVTGRQGSVARIQPTSGDAVGKA